MPKGRKPAIANIARPQGVLDDIVRPIIQKGAQAVAKKTLTPARIKTYTKFPADTSMGRAIRRKKTKTIKENVGSKAVDLNDKMARKRSESYKNLAGKGYDSGNDKLMNVGMAKGRAVRSNQSVRKAAKVARRRMDYR